MEEDIEVKGLNDAGGFDTSGLGAAVWLVVVDWKVASAVDFCFFFFFLCFFRGPEYVIASGLSAVAIDLLSRN